MIDRKQRQCTLDNVLRWLIVEANNTKPIIKKFYNIHVQWWADFTTRMLLGMNSSFKFKTQWFNLSVKIVAELKGILNLILGHIRTHFQTMQDENVGYFGMELYKDIVGESSWTQQ
jgi:hypothetical protein